MRHLFLFIPLFVLLFSCGKKEEPKTTIDLQYISDFPAEVMISYRDENMLRIVDTLDLKSEEDALLDLNITQPSSVFVRYNNKQQEFYLLPNGSLIVKEGNGDVLGFEGETTAENNFLQAIKVDKDLKKLVWNYDSELDEFKGQVNEYFDYRDSVLINYVKENDFFVHYVKLNTKAYRNNVIMSYVQNNRSEDEMQEQLSKHLDMELSEQEKVIPYWGDQLSIWYDRYYLDYLQLQKYGDKAYAIRRDKGYYEVNAETIVEEYQSPIKESLLTELLRVYPLVYKDVGNIITPRALLDKHREDLLPDTFNMLDAEYTFREKKEQRIAKGQLMKTFEYQDSEGNRVVFPQEEANLPTLIDVWASWCGPCIVSFPKVLELEKKYKGKLNVVSISIDDDFESFVAGLEKNEVPGDLKLLAAGGWGNDFSEHNLIQGIPRYMLIDAEGRFLDSNISLTEVDKYVKD